MVTDLASSIFNNDLLLNAGRVIRMLLLLFFILENIRYFKQIKQFFLYKVSAFFAFALFIYVFTDKDIFEGLWLYFRILFWALGLNVLYVYFSIGYLKFKDYLRIIKLNILIATGFSLFYYLSGSGADYSLASYTIVFLYPALLFNSEDLKKNKLFILFAAIAVFISLKRGALLAFSVASLLYLAHFVFKTFTIKNLILGSAFLVVFILSGYYFFNHQREIHAERFTTEQFDINNPRAGSGRIGLYTGLIHEWKAASTFTKIFGFGNQADSRRIPNRRTHAHSDFFGFIYNYGLVGVFLIVLVYFALIKIYLKIKNSGNTDSIYILIMLVLFIMVSIYTGVLRNPMILYLLSVICMQQVQLEADESTTTYE